MNGRSLVDLAVYDDEGALRVVVESPAGSSLKLSYDPKLDVFVPSRALIVGLTYPYDWGFVPQTLAEDGDPLDAMVLSSSRGSAPGVVWACDPIGVLKVRQPAKARRGTVRNDRILAKPRGVPRDRSVETSGELSERFRAELEQFFLATVVLDKPGVELLGWGDPDEAREIISRASTA